MAELVAKRYAKALFDVALELNKLDVLKEEINSISWVLESENKLKAIFEHPKLSKQEKKDIVNSLFKGKATDEIMNFLYILVDKRREKYISAIKKEYNSLYNTERGLIEGTITTAVPMSVEDKIKLQDKLSKEFGKTIILDNIIDDSVIGGVLIRIQDKIIDSSVKGMLEDITKNLNNVRVTEIGVND